MIPGGDHSSRSLLFRRIRSWSEVRHQGTTSDEDDTAREQHGGGDRGDRLHRRPLLRLTSSLSANDESENGCSSGDDMVSPLLPRGHSLEYEEQSCESSVDQDNDDEEEQQQHCSQRLASTDWKLWIVFGLLVASGVGNVIFAKLQSLPM